MILEKSRVKVFSLHEADEGLIVGAKFGPLDLARNNPWTLNKEWDLSTPEPQT